LRGRCGVRKVVKGKLGWAPKSRGGAARGIRKVRQGKNLEKSVKTDEKIIKKTGKGETGDWTQEKNLGEVLERSKKRGTTISRLPKRLQKKGPGECDKGGRIRGGKGK